MPPSLNWPTSHVKSQETARVSSCRSRYRHMGARRRKGGEEVHEAGQRASRVGRLLMRGWALTLAALADVQGSSPLGSPCRTHALLRLLQLRVQRGSPLYFVVDAVALCNDGLFHEPVPLVARLLGNHQLGRPRRHRLLGCDAALMLKVGTGISACPRRTHQVPSQLKSHHTERHPPAVPGRSMVVPGWSPHFFVGLLFEKGLSHGAVEKRGGVDRYPKFPTPTGMYFVFV